MTSWFGPSVAVEEDRRPTRLLLWPFYVLVFSLPFEVADRTVLPVDLPTLTATLFMGASLFALRTAYGRVPAAIWGFVGYIYALLVSFVLNGGLYASELPRLLVFLVQGFFVFWGSYNLMRDPRLASRVLLVFGLACVLRAVLQTAGVASEITPEGRTRTLGQNANSAAFILSIGLTALLGLAYTVRVGVRVKPKLLVWSLVGLIGIAIAQTGSRGGLVALALGLLAFGLTGGSLWKRVRNGMVASLAVLALGAAVLSSNVMSNRFERTLEAGSLAGRERIFPGLIAMAREKPLFGWGPIANKYELGERLNEPARWRRRDAHNLFLEVQSSAGIFGLLPFLATILLCGVAAWRARDGPHGVLPLALFTVVIAGNMSHNWIASKIVWLVLAYAITSQGSVGWQTPPTSAAAVGSG
jgi:O-antigen ligase